MKTINITRARTHNLKNISLEIPRDQLVIITGLSGSGKSSLAFDTLYAEGQRRYVESLSAYARQFLSMMEKPDVDKIEGLSPAIAIEQKSTSHNPRSTVGTVTEIYDYFRLLFARIGLPHCPKHNHPLRKQTIDQIANKLSLLPAGSRLYIGSPMVREKRGSHEVVFDKLEKEGLTRALCDGYMIDIDERPKLDPKVTHTIDGIIDRLVLKDNILLRLRDSLETALRIGNNLVSVILVDEDQKIIERTIISSEQACPDCGFSLPELEPKMFSFNNPVGSCNACDGIGFEYKISPERVVQKDLTLSQGSLWGFDRQHLFYFEMLQQFCQQYGINMDTPFSNLSEEQQTMILTGTDLCKTVKLKNLHSMTQKTRTIPWEGIIGNLQRRFKTTEQDSVREQLKPLVEYMACDQCLGTRLKPAYINVKINSYTIADFCQHSIQECLTLLNQLVLDDQQQSIAQQILEELKSRLGFLLNVGLNYLSLNRQAETLSGGESQRIRLASQIGSKLVGVMYILDEPSIGLHQRDNEKLIKTLRSLVELGNTVIVVEHDEDAMWAADHLIDIGPGAGHHGGQVMAQGSPKFIASQQHSLTGQYLSGLKRIHAPFPTKGHDNKFLTIEGAYAHNLKNITARIPAGLITCITGVSGSGKSTLINHTLYPYLAHKLNQAFLSSKPKVKNFSGLEHFDKVVCIDQMPIGRTPRSNPATYTGLLTSIRDIFAQTPHARSLGFKPGRFSFNVHGGRCDHCEGDGVIKVEMHFLADVYVTCSICKGQRYNDQTLTVTYKDKNIAQILQMSVDEAYDFFKNVPAIAKKLETLQKVGLGYIHLGQNATTLSGGEAQRVKLSKELARRDTGRTFYILDEPTTGLHFEDVQHLLRILFELRERGNTLCIIEHNLDVIKCADWIIDMGPEGGEGGGNIIIQGNLETVKTCIQSHTGYFLQKMTKDQKATS
ncbi:excinuclease ABC subunit UvrA [bacterium]|nr:excinuclease ABC subunit UvrA [bacterium]NBX71921.1 excinuclease ABC subunit UvrA [bacterium]